MVYRRPVAHQVDIYTICLRLCMFCSTGQMSGRSVFSCNALSVSNVNLFAYTANHRKRGSVVMYHLLYYITWFSLELLSLVLLGALFHLGMRGKSGNCL